MISPNIQKYIENSKIRGQLAGWKKPVVNYFITPPPGTSNTKDFIYFQTTKAANSWNAFLLQNSIPIQFQEIFTPNQADIVVHRTKVGRVYEGMCKYLSVINGEIKKISIDIGLPNEFSGKETSDLSIYCAIMHEFGHALGLGHGVDIDDIMFVPHQENISSPSENDLYILKKIYN